MSVSQSLFDHFCATNFSLDPRIGSRPRLHRQGLEAFKEVLERRTFRLFGKARKVKYRRLIPALLCCSLLASCGGSGGSPAAFTGSTASQVTPAPTNPQPVTVRAVEAFPNLSLSAATAITHAGDGTDRLFVAELSGKIKVFENNAAVQSSSVFLDLSNIIVTGDGRGLLGLAFDPDYQNNVFFSSTIAPRPQPPANSIAR